MEEDGEQQEVADGDKEYQPQHGTPLVPDAPRFDVMQQELEHSPSVQHITYRRDKPEEGCHQAFVALIHAESKWLQQPEYRPDEKAIDDAVAEPFLALLKWIGSGEE